jgi:hypothetical protein
LSPINLEGVAYQVANRLKADITSKFDKDGNPKLKLQEAILVGNYQNQVLDIFIRLNFQNLPWICIVYFKLWNENHPFHYNK